MAQSTAETVGNYTSTNISAAKLTSPTSVVLDFTTPIVCDNTNTVTVGVGITDIAGNKSKGPGSRLKSGRFFSHDWLVNPARYIFKS